MSRFSIILPVRNGGNYLKECVRSVLAQSFESFELLVLENASTDNTLRILASFNDPRIKIFPAEKPLSMEENWARALEVPRQEFMTLIGHDDILDSRYLEMMQGLIQEFPDASLYQAHFNYIDSEGQEIGKCQPMQDYQLPPVAVSNFLTGKTDLMGTGFMMRSADYDAVGGIPSYPNLLFADMQLWIELGRKTYLAVHQDELFSYRKHPSATTSSSSDERFIRSFDQLVQYLKALKKTDPELAPVITRDAAVLLRQYCQGITHKVLRTPKAKRETGSVSALIEQFRQYGQELCDGSFEPMSYSQIRMGKIIDSSRVLHTAFLLFKRLRKKPVLKTH